MTSKLHQEIYSLTPDGLPHGPSRTADDRRQRSERAKAAREIAAARKLSQAIIDRAASYAADGGRSAEQAIEAAIAAD